MCQTPDCGVPSAAASCQGQPCGQPCGEACREGCLPNFLNRFACADRWSFTADILAVQRMATRSQPLAYRANGDELWNANNMNFPMAAGIQFSAIRHDVCGFDVEVGYFQLDGWIADADMYGESYPVLDASGSSFASTGEHFHYSSALHAGEITLRREWCDGLTLLAGFRTGELDEFLSNTGFNRADQFYNEEVRTFNHLYGFQLGADWEFYNMGGPLRISALCKGGVYGNVAIQSTALNVNGAAQTLAASRNQTAFMGEAGLVATYQWNRHLGFRLCAQAVWIEGVALAPEQVGEINALAGTASIDTHGGIFYYGGGAGVEVKF